MDGRKKNGFLLIGESLHILNPKFQKAVEHQDAAALARLAGQQVLDGAMALDINLGPAKAMADSLPWVVEAIQQQHPVPLFLPALGNNLYQALQIHQGQATINAVTAHPSQLTEALFLARDFDANLVVLLTKPGLQAFDVQQRLHIALEVLELADSVGLPQHRLYLDPLFSVRTDPLTWSLSRGFPDLDPVLQTISLIGDLSNQQANTILALSNGSVGLPAQKRSQLHCRILPLLVEAGLDAAVLNCRDQVLMDVARKQKAPLHKTLKAA